MATDPPLVPPASVADRLEGIRAPVALTGGTGFVGSHLVETLCGAGLRPRVLVRNPRTPRWIAGQPVEWIPGSLDEQEALERLVAGAGTVIHLAGVLRAGSDAEFERGNREGTRSLVRAVERSASVRRFVYVSSLAAAGPSSSIEGVGPDVEPRPISAYGRSKLAAENVVRRLDGKVPWLILRPPAIYGPRDTDVFQFFRLAASHFIPIPAGDRWLTVAYVADVVRAVLAAAGGDAPVGRIYHLGEPEPYRLAAMVRLLAAAGGVRAKVVPLPASVLTLAGRIGSGLHGLGMHRVAMTRDKARELTARHWTAATRESLETLRLSEWVDFSDGAALSWAWYRVQGWLG